MELQREAIAGNVNNTEAEELIQRAEELLRDIRRFQNQQQASRHYERISQFEGELDDIFRLLFNIQI